MPDETDTVAAAPPLAEQGAPETPPKPAKDLPTFAMVVDGKITNHHKADPTAWSPPAGSMAVDITGHETEDEVQIGQPWPPLTPEQKAAAEAAKKSA